MWPVTWCSLGQCYEEHSAGNCFKLKIKQLKEKIGFIIPSVYSIEKNKTHGEKKKNTWFQWLGTNQFLGCPRDTIGQFWHSRNSFVLLPTSGARGKPSTNAVIRHPFQTLLLWPISLPVPSCRKWGRTLGRCFPEQACFLRGICLFMSTFAFPADSCTSLCLFFLFSSLLLLVLIFA